MRKNVAAQALGRMAGGKTKNYSKAERNRRRQRLAQVRVRRWADVKEKPPFVR